MNSYQEWIAVFHGPFHEALAVQATLGAHGITGFIPNETMKVVDPFITGGSAMGGVVLVHFSEFETAQEILEQTESPIEPTAEDEVDEVDGLEELGLTVQWCFFVPIIGWAAGVFFGLRYYTHARHRQQRPRRHAITLGFWLLQGILLVISLVGIFCLWA